MANRITISGLDEINKTLRGLEAKLAKKLIKAAARRAMKPVRDAVRNALPVGATGQLRRAVKIVSGRGRNGRISFKVTIDKKAFPKGFYGAAVEFGTAKQKGQHPVQVAFEASKEKAAADFETEMKRGFESALKSS